MTADLLRASTPIDDDVVVAFRPSAYSSRTSTVYGTVVDHSGDTLYLGVHPDLLAIPFDRIDGISR